ncbi:helix-turn-helix domain-containing protein, partial [Staphylococcus haemolyticus]|uniref:helix-turn-helix domain-containing protein n=1 Tax=Staphylococcus haemolyticus TaxID=1283 RepID=UPI00214D89B9
MNLEHMMDTIIGDKIKKIRKSQGLTQEAFCEKYENEVSIDKYRLSALENGRREKNKNPHFLTEEYKKLFSKLLNVDSKTFVFGNNEEKHQLIKLILLNILMNGTTNSSHRNDPKIEQIPIFEFSNDLEFFRLSYLNLDNEQLKNMAFDIYSNMVSGKKYSESELETRKNQIIKELQSYDNFFYNQDHFRYYKLIMDGKQCFSKQSS